MNYQNGFLRIGTLPHKSYFIPFDKKDKIGTKYGIVDSHFFSPNLDTGRKYLIISGGSPL